MTNDGRSESTVAPFAPPSLRGGVSAAEKYAELEARGEERPRCECHGVMMLWSRDARWHGGAGGLWRCRERHVAYYIANREKHNARMLKHQKGLLERGLCTQCGKQPLATEGGWRCNSCLDKRITPEALLKTRRRQALARMKKRHQTREEELGSLQTEVG